MQLFYYQQQKYIFLMSSSYYNQKWEQAINDLLQQLEDQTKSSQFHKQQKNNQNKKPDIQWFQYFSNLYIKYIDVYRKLEDCYDQIINPQKRLLLRQMLDNTMVRMCQIKQNVIKYSTSTNIIRSDFINFDQIVMDLKLTPKCLQIPIPRYFKQQDKKKLEERNALITQIMIQSHDTAQPEEQVFEDRSSLDANFETAVRIIQKIERGRQGILRGLEAERLKNRFISKKMMREGVSIQQEQINKIVIVQKYWRSFLARKTFYEQRQYQQKFLGMKKDPIKQQIQLTARENRESIKKTQQKNQKKFVDQQQKIKQEIKWAESLTIKDRLLNDRRKWIHQYFFMHQMKKLPIKASQFYSKDKPPKQLKIPKLILSKQQKTKSPTKKQKSQRKKGDKQSESVVSQLTKNIQKYSSLWTSRNQSDIIEPFNLEMARNSLRPSIQKQFQEVVDSMISLELDNMRIQYGIKKKKLKKKKRKAKKKKKQKVKIPQGLGKKDPKQLLTELIEQKIIKYLKPAKIHQFIGQHNPLGSLIQKKAEMMPDPSYAQIRQVITQYIAMPLGSKFAKSKLKKMRWFYFFGPTGTGKTHIIRSLQTECNTLVFDLTPSNIQNKYMDKKSIMKLVWMVIIVAKKYQPSIIFFDQFQKIYPKKKKKKKQNIVANSFAPKMKKALTQMKKNKLWTKTDRITVIACSNKPYDGNMKTSKKMFDKKIYFPYPNYATRKLIFQKILTQKLHETPYNLSLGTIAQISEGFTAGSYKQCIQRVLSDPRIKRLSEQPLRLSQFIVPLSNTICTYAQQYERMQIFTYDVTGLKKKRKKRDAQQSPQKLKQSGDNEKKSGQKKSKSIRK